ncbi:MAG: DNA cytosine methyltransferase [Gemmatimonadota bacterium]
MIFPQMLLALHGELVVDLFAGGGGASVGIELALGRSPDLAVNHNPAALAMHQINHPQTQHFICDVFEVDPRVVCRGRRVGLLWLSPDCTYFSKSRGGKPIRSAKRKRRALAWVAKRWAGTVRPRVLILENVEEFVGWGPLVGPPDALRPCSRRRGRTFRRFVRDLEALGYVVEWRELRASDYGAPTIRKRFFMIARCDGAPIVWPEPTHGDPVSPAVRAGKLQPYRTAAECIDWSIPMCSIFATREEAKAWGKAHGQASPKRPLEAATNRRIARGVMRFVVNNPSPFVVPVQNAGGGSVVHSMAEPLRTVTAYPKGGGFAMAAPVIAGVGGRQGQSPERPADAPYQTVTAKGDSALVAPVLSPLTHQGDRRAHPLTEPAPTVTGAQRGELGLFAPVLADVAHGEVSPSGVKRWGTGARSVEDPTASVVGSGNPALVAPYLVPRYGERDGQEPRTISAEEPMPTVVGTGNGGSLVAVHVQRDFGNSVGHPAGEPMGTVTAGAGGHGALIAANLATYYGEKREGDGRAAGLEQPLATQTTENRHALVATFLAQNNAGTYTGDGRAADEPVSTILQTGSHQSVVAASLTKLRGTSSDASPEEPLHTVSAQGTHHGLTAVHLTKFNEKATGTDPRDPLHTAMAGATRHGIVAAHLSHAYTSNTNGGQGDPSKPLKTITTAAHAGLVYAFLQPYYGAENRQGPGEPLRTIPTVDRFGLVTVQVDGQPYVIPDIAMRMLQPRELYRAQGFPDSYIIDRGPEGRKLTKTEQVQMCGNSVCPPIAAALARANVPELIVREAPAGADPARARRPRARRAAAGGTR